MSYWNRVQEAIKTMIRDDVLVMDQDTADYLTGEGANYEYNSEAYGYFISSPGFPSKFFMMVPDCGAFIIRAYPTRWEFIE